MKLFEKPKHRKSTELDEYKKMTIGGLIITAVVMIISFICASI